MIEEWEEGKEEEMETLKVPPEFRECKFESTTLTVRELFSFIITGDLILEPEFQRHYVWDVAKASRFIESLIIGLPVPPIFLADEDNKFIVIDGHQRLETIFRFLQPLTSGILTALKAKQSQRAKIYLGPPLRLRGLEVFPEFNGKGAEALSIGLRAKLWDYKIPVIRILKENHPDIKFKLFERLNLGSMTLNSQELRNCLYRGPYNRLLQELEEDPRVLKAFGKNKPDKRMRDREKVLAFFAFAHRLDRYQSPFQSFLNMEMEANQHADREQLKEFRREFFDALDLVESVFGKESFRVFQVGSEDDIDGHWSTRRFNLIYEVEMVGFHKYGETLRRLETRFAEDKKIMFRTGLRFKLIEKMNDVNFKTTLERMTKAEHVVRQRFRLWNEAIEEAIEDPPGLINSTKKALDLLRQSNQCSICPKRINSPDDAKLIRSATGVKIAHRGHKTI